ncbi:MAG: site-specific integrase [Streptosporangiaceae bacterium]
MIVPRAGSVQRTGDPWEPFRLIDPEGAVVAPAVVYLRELQACGRPENTLRSYAIALLRWFRFLRVIGVPWDQATRIEARDFCCWIQIAVKPAGCGPPG